jgi:two-component system LytT family sensor kinase
MAVVAIAVIDGDTDGGLVRTGPPLSTCVTTRPMQRRWAAWALVFAGWALITVVFAVSSSLTLMLTYQPAQWERTFATSFAEWAPWAAMTPAIAWLARRFRLQRTKWLRGLLVLGFTGLIVAFLKLTFTRMLRSGAGVGDYIQITNFATQYVIYWLVVAAVHAADTYQGARERELRASQLEASLADARLQLLRMQLQPHFLFNTLNTIAELVHESPADAERMIAGLSVLLRETLDASTERVTLAKELLFLERYIDIQRVRFGDRLTFITAIADDARDVLVPALLLQPLVENSIKYGLASRVEAGRIEVRARREESSLVLEVEDDGAGFSAGTLREGVGLSNTRGRLAQLFGAAQRVEIDTPAAGGAIVRITLPWVTALEAGK